MKCLKEGCYAMALEGDYCEVHKNAGLPPRPPEAINHPPHYGGAGNPYEAIKVIEAWTLGFCLGSAVKYIARAGKKVSSESSAKAATLEDLKKARWYLDREIKALEGP